jgi:membrane-bound metal-dependent hydrolase YbcI (DUF457 family)
MLAAFASGYGVWALADSIVAPRATPLAAASFGGNGGSSAESDAMPRESVARSGDPAYRPEFPSAVPAIHFVGLALVGVLPDLDLLTEAHSGWTHSLGAAGLVAGIAAALGRRRRAALAAAVFAAYASHVLLDWVSRDEAVPIGIMALWPFSVEYWHAPVDLFLATERRYWLSGFWTHNALAGLVELLWLGPPAALLFRRHFAFAGRAAVRTPGRSRESTTPPPHQARSRAGS